MRLELLPHRQEHRFTCVPACLHIALAYHGLLVPETDLTELCGTNRAGTNDLGLLRALDQLGCSYQLLPCGSLAGLREAIGEELPVIVFLRLDLLNRDMISRHAVVVAGFEGEEQEGQLESVIVLDPATGNAEVLSSVLFQAAWVGHGSDAVVLLELP
jgi:ABC-type bacteriocin/lantibiotic exporter with double-glycine peptidase domain